MIVVSNASPIISLSAIAQFELLQRLYDHVTIPEAVYREVVLAGSGRPGASDVQLAPWIAVQQVADPSLVTHLLEEVNPGEAEAIILTVELRADLLLLDERRARAVAARFGLAVTGVLGVLLVAKQRGVIPVIKPLLDALIATAGYRVSERLYARALEAAGEG